MLKALRVLFVFSLSLLVIWCGWIFLQKNIGQLNAYHDQTLRWASASDTTSQRPITEELFERLMGTGAIELNTDTFEILIPPCEAIDGLLRDGWNGRFDYTEEQQSLLELSCRAFTRSDLREVLEFWNDGLRSAAIRDTRRIGVDTDFFVVSRGTHTNLWRAETHLGEDGSGASSYALLDSETLEEPSPDLFGYITCESRRRFSDWLTVEGQSMRFSSVFEAEHNHGSPRHIQLIGAAPGSIPVVRLSSGEVLQGERICARSNGESP